MPWDPEELRDYHNDISIDPGRIGEEWLEQPNLYMHYAAEAAHRRLIRDRAQEKVKVVRSELIIEAKSGLVQRLGSNPTAQVIEAYYRTHPNHKEAADALADAEYELSMAESAVFAMNHRRYSLENTVRLVLGEFYSLPTEGRDLSDFTPRKTRQLDIADEEYEELSTMVRTTKAKTKGD